jgi:Aspartyl protease
VRINFQRNELTFFDLAHFTYQGGGTAVPLILNKHGNGIYLDAKVDGIKGRFQLDSGNETGFFLNAAFVDKHHLQQKLHATLRGYNGKGLGGDSPEAWLARVHTLSIGSIVLNDPVVSLQTAKDKYNQKLAGNIGQSILKRFTVTVDCRHHVMYLEKLPDWDERELFNRAGLLYDGQDGGDEIKTVFPRSSCWPQARRPHHGHRRKQASRSCERPCLYAAHRLGSTPDRTTRRPRTHLRCYAT